jgi:capsular polysaccharide biosynthesis protein
MMISDVYRTLWRQRWFVVLVTALVVAGAYVLTSRQTKLYTASSLVRVQQNVRTSDEVFGALLTGERLARTYERIAETSSVADLVKDRLPRRVPPEAVAIDAAQLSNLELLEISVTNADPDVAATVANAVPGALADFIDATGSFRDTITVVERASTPSTPTSPNLRLNLVLAFLLGLILAAGLALLRESLSDRIETIEELEKVAGHPVIAVIPNLKFQRVAPVARSRSGGRVSAVATRGGTVPSINPVEGEAASGRSNRG